MLYIAIKSTILDKTSKPCYSSFIVVYTVLCILRRMKQEVGLEAMLEYHARYLETIETHNPQLKSAVTKALCLMSVEKMYRDAMK